MNGRARLVSILALAAFLGWPRDTRAEPRPEARPQARSGATLVAIITAEPNASLTRRVRAELEALGVDVMVLNPPDASPSRTSLEQAARGVGAAAAIRLVPSPEGRIEVWVADRVTGKTVVRDLDPSEAGDGGAAGETTLALGTIELFRASLMELHAPERPRGEVEPTPKLEALSLPPPASKTPPELPRLGVAVHGGAELGVRGLGPTFDMELDLWVRLWWRLGVRAFGGATLVPSEVETPDGSVSVRAVTAGGLFVYDFVDPDEAWVPQVSLGLAATYVTATGTAEAPYAGTTVDRWAAMPVAGVGLGWAFARGIRLRADARIGWALPDVQLRTPSGEAGKYGAPAILLAPGLEILWGM